MKNITRREFLRKLGATGAMGALSRFGGLALTSTLARAAGEDYRALVCVFLFGGNDGNNTIMPISGDQYAAYSAIRGRLAIPAQDIVPLRNATGTAAHGMHPQLASLKDLWDAGAMAVLLNVGTLAKPTTKAAYRAGRAPKPDGLFSHADQQKLWQGTGPNSLLRSGWGGRIADRLVRVNGASPVPMVISVSSDNLYVTGNTTSALVLPASGSFSLSGTSNTAESYARRLAQDRLLAVDRDAVLMKNTGDVLARALAGSEIINPVITADSSALDGLFAGQATDFARQLLQVARLIEARTVLGARRQIFFVSLGGFDTHGNQLGEQSAQFAQLAPALKSFYDATVQLGVASSVTSFTHSDFGRTLQPNTDGGTDHGWGSHHLVIGGAVRGGRFYGQFPLLALDGPDDAGEEGRWIPTTSVDQYAATLATWFGVSTSDLPAVVPNIARFPSSDLGFLA